MKEQLGRLGDMVRGDKVTTRLHDCTTTRLHDCTIVRKERLESENIRSQQSEKAI